MAKKTPESKNGSSGPAVGAPPAPAEVTKAAAPPGADRPDPAAEKERKFTPMEASRFKPTEYLRNSFVATAFDHTNPQDPLKPEYWAHVSHQMRPRDRVEIWANDGTWMAEYVVLDASRSWARVHILSIAHFTTADQAQTMADSMSPYEITHRGPHLQWSVIRKADRQVVHEGSATLDAATTWLKERMKAER